MIESLISSISVLLVFMIFFTDKSVNFASSILILERPSETREHDTAEYKVKIFRAKAMMVMAIVPTLSVFLVYLNQTCTIIFNSNLTFKNFDTLNTSFVLIEFFILCLIIYQIYWFRFILKKQ